MLLCDVVKFFLCVSYKLLETSISPWGWIKYWLTGKLKLHLASNTVLYSEMLFCCFSIVFKLPVLTSTWHLPPRNSPFAVFLLWGTILCKPCDVKIQVDQQLPVKHTVQLVRQTPCYASTSIPLSSSLWRSSKSSWPRLNVKNIDWLELCWLISCLYQQLHAISLHLINLRVNVFWRG